MAGVLFEDIFDVKDIDPEGKKFDRGKSSYHRIFENYLLVYSSIHCHSLIVHWGRMFTRSNLLLPALLYESYDILGFQRTDIVQLPLLFKTKMWSSLLTV